VCEHDKNCLCHVFCVLQVGLLVWPLLAGWPQAAVMVSARDAALLLGISCTSFSAQLLMTRAFQLLHAARASSLNFLGVVYSHALVSEWEKAGEKAGRSYGNQEGNKTELLAYFIQKHAPNVKLL
jgi:hypothetical protein